MSLIPYKGHKGEITVRPKMAEFRLKSRYIQKLLTDFDDFGLGKCRIQELSLIHI